VRGSSPQTQVGKKFFVSFSLKYIFVAKDEDAEDFIKK